MNVEFKELLMNRLKLLEFDGHNSPTMQVINKNNLNPKIYKLKKIFTKASLMNKHKDLKINLANLHKKKSLHTVNESILLPENLKQLNSDNYKNYRFNRLPSLKKLDYLNQAAFRRKEGQRYQHEPAKSMSVEPFNYRIQSKKIKLLPCSPKDVYMSIKKFSENQAVSIEVSQSLNIAPSKRIILSKTKEIAFNNYAIETLENVPQTKEVSTLVNK